MLSQRLLRAGNAYDRTSAQMQDHIALSCTEIHINAGEGSSWVHEVQVQRIQYAHNIVDTSNYVTIEGIF